MHIDIAYVRICMTRAARVRVIIVSFPAGAGPESGHESPQGMLFRTQTQIRQGIFPGIPWPSDKFCAAYMYRAS